MKTITTINIFSVFSSAYVVFFYMMLNNLKHFIVYDLDTKEIYNETYWL